MIDDPELFLLFQSESEEHLVHLKESARQLDEKSGHDLIDTMLRDIHTLKGAARMLSIDDVATATSSLEAILNQLRQGSLKWHGGLVKEILGKISDIEQLILRHIHSFTSTSIKSETPFSEPAKEDITIISTQRKPESIPEHTIDQPVLNKGSSTHTEVLQSPTLRIAKKQIIELTRHAADLLVTQNKLTTFVDDIESILHIIEQAIENLSIEWRGKYPVQWIEILKEIEKELAHLRERTHEDIFKLSSITSLLIAEIKSLGLLPFNKIFELFPPMISDLAHALGKEILFSIEGGDITVDKKIIEEMKDPIMHILRNAIAHGIESPEQREQLSKPKEGKVTLRAQQISQTILIDISDDGQGLDLKKIQQKALAKKLISEEDLPTMSAAEIYSLIFVPGFSTADEVSDISGLGIGLDVVKEHVENLQGTIQIESQSGQGCRFIIELPTTVLTTRVSVVQIYQEIYAIPIEGIESVFLIFFDEIFQIHNRDVILYKNRPIPIHFLANLLNIPTQPNQNRHLSAQHDSKIPCIVLNVRGRLLAVIVDAILDEQQVVLIPFKSLLEGTPNFAGATTLKTGRVCLVVDPVHLVKSVQVISDKGMSLDKLKEIMKKVRIKKKVLLVDDSYAIRLYCKKILEDSGYEVVIAENGREAIQKFDEDGIDIVITDIQMPEMDGLALTKIIREERKNFTLPIILITALESDNEFKAGMEAGANAYIRKSAFSQKELMELMRKFS